MRPDFAMLTGVEYLLPSVPLGGVGSYSAAGSICPNLCSRLFNMVGKYFEGAVPEVPIGHWSAEETVRDEALREIAATLPVEYERAMAKLDYAGALELTWSLVKGANRYIEESAPWTLAKDEATHGRLAAVIYHALEAVRIAALFTAPVMPQNWKALA